MRRYAGVKHGMPDVPRAGTTAYEGGRGTVRPIYIAGSAPPPTREVGHDVDLVVEALQRLLRVARLVDGREVQDLARKVGARLLLGAADDLAKGALTQRLPEVILGKQVLSP